MKFIAVVGGRDFGTIKDSTNPKSRAQAESDYKLLAYTLNDLINIPTDVTIVSGGARGADTLAENYAKMIGVNTIIFKADWKKYGRAAGMIRNKDIIAQADVVVAFWDGKSKGTKKQY